MKNMNELTPRQAATRLGVALSYLYSMLWTGRIAGRKDGAHWRIPAAAVEARLQRLSRREVDSATAGR
jgi:excisionase family DNA binding protein